MEGAAVGCQENPRHRELGETERRTIEEANIIKEDQCNHEAEVTLGGEGDLHVQYKTCNKNPGHVNFKPVKDFKIEDLPEGYQDKEIMEWIKIEAGLTCRVAVKCTSKSRPEYYPGTRKLFPFHKYRGMKMQRNGTGSVMFVSKYTDPNTKRKQGVVTIGTANHMVFNSEEAMRATCYFFYDESTNDLTKFRTLTNFNVRGSNIAGDWCIMTTVICDDMTLVDELDEKCDRRLELFERVRAKYWLDQRKGLFGPGISRVPDPTSGPVVIISHPHGCDKHITVGEWTHRETRGETKNYEVNSGVKAEYVSSSYRYNAPTCPGSSGAPVIRLLEKGRVGWWWLLYPHPHSEGKPGNDNSSGMMEEFVSFPPTSSDRWSKSTKIAVGLFTFLTFGVWVAVACVTQKKLGTPILWFTPFVMVIPPLCYLCIRPCRKHRQICLFNVIPIVMFIMGVIVLSMEVANMTDIIFILVILILGLFCIIYVCIVTLCYRRARVDKQSSLIIQKRLRQLIMMETSSVPSQATSRTTPPTTASSTTAAATATTTTVDMTYGTIANTAEPTDYSDHPRPSRDHRSMSVCSQTTLL